MKKKIWVAGMLAVVMLLACAGCQREIPREEKEVVSRQGLWPGYTFEEAVAEAETIVYGKAVSKSGIMEHEISLNPERSDKEYYCEVYLKPIELLKGEENEDGTVTVLDFEVETDTHIYDKPGVDPVELEKEYIFFLNEHGSSLNPQMMIPVEDGMMKTAILPEKEDSDGKSKNAEAEEETTQVKEVAVEEYIAMIEEAM